MIVAGICVRDFMGCYTFLFVPIHLNYTAAAAGVPNFLGTPGCPVVY